MLLTYHCDELCHLARQRPLLAGHSARNFSGICRRGGDHNAHVTLFPNRCVIAALQSVHLSTRPRLSRAFLSSLTLANALQHWALSSARQRGLRGVSWCFGRGEVEPLSRPRHSGHPGQPCPVPCRGTMVALVGAGAGCQVTHSGAQRVTARSRLGLRAGSPCSVLCLLAAAFHCSTRLPGAGAWGAGADVARDSSAAPGPGPEVLSSLFLCSPCTTSPPTPGSIMRTSKCEYSWAAVQTRGRWGDRPSGLGDLGWDVGSQFPTGLPGRARCQRKGREGAVWARILGQVGLMLGSEQAWGREGQREVLGPTKHWDAGLPLGRAVRTLHARLWGQRGGGL